MARVALAARDVMLPAGWTPRGYQWPLWRYLWGGGKRGVAVWHRRAGKDDVALHWSACAMHMRVGTYWHMLPEASQARKAIWDAINPHTGRRRIDEAFPQELRASTREHDMLIRLKVGSTWQVVGSDNYNSLVGSPPVGIVFSEWALADPTSWSYLRPILAENGGWCLFIYTPRGKDHGESLYRYAKEAEGWHAEVLTVEDTTVFSAEQMEAERAEYLAQYPVDGASRFRQEYYCDFEVAVPGSVYGVLLEQAKDARRIGRVPHDPAVPVDTWWDLGYSDSTAIWFTQRVGPEIRVIDYYVASGADLAFYAGKLAEKARPVGQGGRGFVYGAHVAPHDAHHKLLASGGRSIADQLRSLGVQLEVQPRADLESGIHAVRLALPRCWFDEEHCELGLAALRAYRYGWNDQSRVWTQSPVHDWSSHGADAFRTGVMALPVGRKGREPIVYGPSGVM